MSTAGSDNWQHLDGVHETVRNQDRANPLCHQTGRASSCKSMSLNPNLLKATVVGALGGL